MQWELSFDFLEFEFWYFFFGSCHLRFGILKKNAMKFVHYLEKTTGVSIYPLLSFTIFGLFFLVMLVWVIKADKKTINDISRIPLD